MIVKEAASARVPGLDGLRGLLAPSRPSAGLVFVLPLCALAFLAMAKSGDPTLAIAGPLAVAMIPIVLIVFCLCMNKPFTLCLLFVIFSFFRIHECFLVLNPLRIPNLLAILTFSALGVNLFLTKKLSPTWHPTFTLYTVFFVHVTLGMIFCQNREEAMNYWTGTYWKIYVICIAIAWLARTPAHFGASLGAIVASGVLVSFVAIYNKLNSLCLVEETRVCIAREIGSVLGDPNDLALALLFPMGFACTMVITKGLPRSQRILGGIAIPIIFWAILCTQSRGGLLGTLAVWGVFANRLIKNKALLLALGAIGVVVLYTVAGISSRQSGGAREEGLDESAMIRIYAWGAARKMAFERPVFGVGLRNFVSNYYAYSDFWDGQNHEVHSTWFGVMAESGYVGFVIFMAILVTCFLNIFYAMRITTRLDAPPAAQAMAWSVFAGFVSFCVSGTFLTQGFSWPFYILMALSVAMSRYASEWEKDHASRRAAAGQPVIANADPPGRPPPLPWHRSPLRAPV